MQNDRKTNAIDRSSAQYTKKPKIVRRGQMNLITDEDGKHAGDFSRHAGATETTQNNGKITERTGNTEF
jgi:4-aminobutyrate aminotransferase-like enzyme